MLAAVNQTLSLVAIVVGSLIGLAGLSTLLYGIRWKGNYEVEKETSRSLREGRDAAVLHGERLAGELLASKEQLIVLEASRSLEPVLKGMLEGFKHMEGQIVRHEERAQARHETNQRQGEAHLRILEMIAEHIGPEPNGNQPT